MSTGATAATDFPITPVAVRSSPPAHSAFGSATFSYVAEITASGDRLVYGTYFGGDLTNCSGGSSCIGVYGRTIATSIGLDSAGAIVLAGNTTASDLAITSGTLGQQCQCRNTVQVGFIAKLAVGGARLAWATYIDLAQLGLPFQSDISIKALAIDREGNVIFGGTAPYGFPVTRGAAQTIYPGGNPPPSDRPYAGFISKVDASGRGYMFSTYLGGNVPSSSTSNGVVALAIDSAGYIWATGGSAPSELPFPVSIPSLGQTYLASLSPDGSVIVSGVTAPAGAAGQSLTAGPNGNVAALGRSGSLLLSSSLVRPSLLGVANSAASEVSGDVAPYELVSLYGIGIGPPEELNGAIVNGTLTNLVGGIQVLFGGIPAPLLYAGPSQLNAIVPNSVVAGRRIDVQIVRNGLTVGETAMSVVSSQPQVFQNLSEAIALNQDGGVNSGNNPALPGSIVTVWATGGGAFEEMIADGSISGSAAGELLLPVSVSTQAATPGSGLIPLEVLYSGPAPGMVTGVLQVNLRIPSQLQNGNGQIVCRLTVGSAFSEPFLIFAKRAPWPR
jgi:uncharacterized protein (TIGR03437 family)